MGDGITVEGSIPTITSVSNQPEQCLYINQPLSSELSAVWLPLSYTSFWWHLKDFLLKNVTSWVFFLSFCSTFKYILRANSAKIGVLFYSFLQTSGSCPAKHKCGITALIKGSSAMAMAAVWGTSTSFIHVIKTHYSYTFTNTLSEVV